MHLMLRPARTTDNHPMTSGSRAHSARRSLAALALGAGACLGLDASAQAQERQAKGASPPDEIRRPQAARRVVRLFDFEEPDNPHPVPDHWFHAQDNPA